MVKMEINPNIDYQNSLREIFRRIYPRPRKILEFGTGPEALSSKVFLEDEGIESIISIDLTNHGDLISHPKWHFICGNSTEVELPINIFYDLIYIDTDHTEGQTLKELERALFLLSDDGLILLDDCLADLGYIKVFEAVAKFLRMKVPEIDLWFSVDPRNHGWGFLRKKPLFELQMGWDSKYRESKNGPILKI